MILQPCQAALHRQRRVAQHQPLLHYWGQQSLVVALGGVSLSEKGDKAGKSAKRNAEKRGSPTSSATNSPKKPASRDHSDEEDPEASKKATAGGGGGGGGANIEPKVPP